MSGTLYWRAVNISIVLIVSFSAITAKDCSRPTLGNDMNLSDDDILKDIFPDGSEANLACAVGHVQAGGSRSITCTAGAWSPVTLECESESCCLN